MERQCCTNDGGNLLTAGTAASGTSCSGSQGPGCCFGGHLCGQRFSAQRHRSGEPAPAGGLGSYLQRHRLAGTADGPGGGVASSLLNSLNIPYFPYNAVF